MTVEELLKLFGADDIKGKFEALGWAQAEGPASAASLVSVLRHQRAHVPAKVWAMIAIGQLGPDVIDVVRGPLVEKLSDPSPTVRRASIRALAELEDVSARDGIARLLDDDTLDPSAWFDDDCTVSQTARAALEKLDSAKVPSS